MKQAYCPECGGKTVLRYPGNDPENGPAEPHCPQHGSINNMCYDWATAHGFIFESEGDDELLFGEEE